MKKSKKTLVWVIFGILLISSFIFMTSGVSNLTKYTPQEEPNSFDEIINNCLDLSLEETSYCFKDNVKTVFSYKTPKNKVYYNNDNFYYTNLTLFSLEEQDFYDYIKEGADCSGWTSFYAVLVDKTNFTWEKIYFGNHEFLRVCNDSMCCNLDQIYVKCLEVKR